MLFIFGLKSLAVFFFQSLHVLNELSLLLSNGCGMSLLKFSDGDVTSRFRLAERSLPCNFGRSELVRVVVLETL